MNRRAPKGLWPASTPVERVGFLRRRLYELYDRDEGIRDALHRFHGQWWTELGPALRRLDDCLPDLEDPERGLAERVGVGPAHDYFDGLGTLAADVGLDRIPMVGTPPAVVVGYLPSGVAQANRYLWHLDKALLWEARDARPAGANGSLPPVVRPTFEALARFGTPIPAVDSSIAGTDARWQPRIELLVEARRRLRQETSLAPEAIETELARIVREGEYQLPDTSTQRNGIWRLDRDAQWTWWRVRRRWTYEQIVREWARMHPGDLRLQYRLEDAEARQWSVVNPLEPPRPVVPAGGVPLVRKAVTTFARRARVDAQTGPGRREH